MADTPHDEMVMSHVQKLAELESHMGTLNERFEEHCKDNITSFAGMEARLVDRFDAKVEIVLAEVRALAVTVTQVNSYLWRLVFGLLIVFVVVFLAVLGFERLAPAIVKVFVP
jgi:hypothetical protein